MIALAERRWLPDALVRVGIRRLLSRRLAQERTRAADGYTTEQLQWELSCRPMTVSVEQANRQHYEIPAAFFQLVLGPRLKYSCGYWPDGVTSLAAAEEAMLKLTCQRAGLRDGMHILELGCGWGSLSLWMAERFPHAVITAVSNSRSQRDFILTCAAQRQLTNLRIITCDVADLALSQRFDRVVSVEMFEHVRNHAVLLERIAEWLVPEGELFVHLFCHKELTYLFQDEGRADWMARHFFTGGMMPSAAWLAHHDRHLFVDEQWMVSGQHYAQTSEAWLNRLDSNRESIIDLFRQDMSTAAARRQWQRWRMFFMACAELFRYRQGLEWYVQHYRMKKVAGR